MAYVNAAVRILIAALAIYAVFNDIVRYPDSWWITFSIQSVMLGAAVMLWGAWAALARRTAPPAWLQAAAAMYLTISAVVYAVVLGYPEESRPVVLLGLINTQLVHLVVPVGAVLVWLVLCAHRRLRWFWIPLVLLPFYAYLGFVVLRAELVEGAGYIYPFIDVDALGWDGVGINVGLYTVYFGVVAAIFYGLDRLLPAGTSVTEGTAGSGE